MQTSPVLGISRESGGQEHRSRRLGLLPPGQGEAAGGHQEDHRHNGEDDEHDKSSMAQLDQKIDVVFIALVEEGTGAAKGWVLVDSK